MVVGLVHGPLVGLLQVHFLRIVPHASTLVAGLLLLSAADNVEDEGVTRHLLVVLDLDHITYLDATPVGPLEALVPLGPDKLLDRLLIDDICGLPVLPVGQVVQVAGEEKADQDNDEKVVVLFDGLVRTGEDHADRVEEDHQVLISEDGIVDEHETTTESLIKLKLN